jgi:hypothetical protein
MPDDLYHRDVLLWSEQQANLLRQLARGERVNNVDWDRVVEEIEDVGISELRSVESFLVLTLLHLLKMYGWPDSPAVDHWRVETAAFQGEAQRRFAPSMRQHLDAERVFTAALKPLQRAKYDGHTPRAFPASCAFTLDQLLNEEPEVLEALLTAPLES